MTSRCRRNDGMRRSENKPVPLTEVSNEAYFSVTGETKLGNITKLAEVFSHLILVETVWDSTKVQCPFLRVLAINTRPDMPYAFTD